MSGFKKGKGVQVVSVENGSYRVCSETLRSVLAREELRGLPVAVVSVAGATRGGKSFLLDFFLRYLRAPPAAQRDGTWIGTDDESLAGFSWCGGSMRNTTGILLWSEPIVVTRQVNGATQKMVVLLMDTQGTFDNYSTVRDGTTIFALSTLISSVQIYNLAQQIKEDDLQHLQFFTQYGKLAVSETESKPFQKLVFRVRDWMCPYEHPYGANGGEKYLESILDINTNKNEELRELREHIRDSFDSISCFLTPHPGFAVADENFSGRLCDLRQEFKDSLLGFVPFILDSSNLIPKVINGQQITAGDLITYFNSYIDVFNSDELPTPVSILKATSSACLEATLTAAREEYVSRMEQTKEGRSMPRNIMPRLHAAAKEAARHAFLARRMLAAPEHAAECLDSLMQELDALLSTYAGLNDAKTQKLVVDARAEYDASISSEAGSQPLCLHPRDVSELHSSALTDAIAIFDAGRQPPCPGDEDNDRTALIQSLEAKLSEAITASNLSNAAAVSQACVLYSACMRREVRDGAVSANSLRSKHEKATASANEDFMRKRSRLSRHPDSDDYFLTDLLKYIQEQYDILETANKAGNKSAKQNAIFSYNNHMASVWVPNMSCLHPDSLAREHREALHGAIQEFRSAADDQDLENEIKEILQRRYEEMRTMNEASNEILVTESYRIYTQNMDLKCSPSVSSILIIPWLVKILVKIPQYHDQYKQEALAHFRGKRRGSGGDDEYIERLRLMLNDSLDTYHDPLKALAREFGIPVADLPLG